MSALGRGAIQLPLGQTDALLGLLDLQAVHVDHGARDLQVMARLEQVVDLGVSLLERREERLLDLLGDAHQVLGALDQQPLAVRRRPERPLRAARDRQPVERLGGLGHTAWPGARCRRCCGRCAA